MYYIISNESEITLIEGNEHLNIEIYCINFGFTILKSCETYNEAKEYFEDFKKMASIFEKIIAQKDLIITELLKKETENISPFSIFNFNYN